MVGDPAVLDQARDPHIHDALTRRTVDAYAKGVFGTATFIWNGDLFFGADQLEVLAWKVNSSTLSQQP